MKNCTIILLSFLSLLVATSCKTNEEKANELIRAELSKTLFDYESYQPVETIVQEAKNTALNNEKCWIYAMAALSFLDEVAEDVEKAREAKDHMEIWGPPSYYTSSYSDRQYNKYKEEAEKHLANGELNLKRFQMASDSLKNFKIKLDTAQIIGWEVHHTFRCKTKGGYASIGKYRYIIDKNFEKIIFHIDTDDEKYASVVDFLSTIDTRE